METAAATEKGSGEDATAGGGAEEASREEEAKKSEALRQAKAAEAKREAEEAAAAKARQLAAEEEEMRKEGDAVCSFPPDAIKSLSSGLGGLNVEALEHVAAVVNELQAKQLALIEHLALQDRKVRGLWTLFGAET